MKLNKTNTMQEPQQLKNHYREQRMFSLRILFSGLVVFTGYSPTFALLDLQVNHHEQYMTQADQNRILIQTINPQRGLIYDTNGLLLADNKASYTLTLTPERVDNFDETLTNITPCYPLVISM